jgi:hypothetical protein
MGQAFVSDCWVDPSVVNEDAKFALRVDDAPINDTAGAVVSGFMCGDQIHVIAMKREPALEALNWRYREDLRSAWPQDHRFMVPRNCFSVTVVGRDRTPKQCVLLVPRQDSDATVAMAQIHMDDAVATATYAGHFNKKMGQALGNVVDFASPDDSAPNLRICAPVACQVLAASSPEVLSRGMACLVIPYPHAEVRKFVFLGGEDFCEVPQAFFHFSAFVSGGQEFVCDIQGTEDVSGDIHILDPIVLRAERTKVQQYITQQWATQAGKTVLQPAVGPLIGPSGEKFDAMHPKCGQLCQSFDPMRKGAKGKKAMFGVTCNA